MITVDKSENAQKAFEYAIENVLQSDGKDVCHLVHHFNIQTYPIGEREVAGNCCFLDGISFFMLHDRSAGPEANEKQNHSGCYRRVLCVRMEGVEGRAIAA